MGTTDGTADGYDAVIAGGSIAGCTAAILLGRAGARVAVVERQRRPDAYKALCGHFILGGAVPILHRLGVWDALLERGAAVSPLSSWTPAGWVEAHGDVPRAISLRRAVLDPLLRELAGSTPGVDVHLGATVVGLVEDGRRVRGVRVQDDHGERELAGRLVVGADGHRSPVAGLAGARTATAPNGRFLYWGYYRHLTGARPGATVWLADPAVAVVVPTDDGLSLAGVFGPKTWLERFQTDRHAAIEAFLAALPDGPSFAGAERASPVIGTSDYPFAKREVVPRPGLALVGDAAMTSDPVPAVGCGWAFRSAAWLVDSVAPALTGSGDLARGLRDYRRRHRFIERYDRLARRDAATLRPNPLQRAVRRAATVDDPTRRRLSQFLMQTEPASVLLNPRALGRAVRVARRAQPVQ